MLPIKSEAAAVQSSTVLRVPELVLVCTERNGTGHGANTKQYVTDPGPSGFLAWINCLASAPLVILHFRCSPVEN